MALRRNSLLVAALLGSISMAAHADASDDRFYNLTKTDGLAGWFTIGPSNGQPFLVQPILHRGDLAMRAIVKRSGNSGGSLELSYQAVCRGLKSAQSDKGEGSIKLLEAAAYSGDLGTGAQRRAPKGEVDAAIESIMAAGHVKCVDGMARYVMSPSVYMEQVAVDGRLVSVGSSAGSQ